MRSKIFVRLALRRMMRYNPEQRDNIKQVLRDSDLLDAVVAESEAMASSEFGAIGDGTFMIFLEWLLDHSDEIFAIISKLLILFAEEAPA